MSDQKHTPGPWSRAYIYSAMRHIERNVDDDCFLTDEDQDALNGTCRWDESLGVEVIIPPMLNKPSCRTNPADVDLITNAPETAAERDTIRSDLARVTAERDRLASIQEDWHTVVRALGRDPGTEHETGRASDDIFDAARILRAQKPGLPIDEAAASLVAERDALKAEAEAMRTVVGLAYEVIAEDESRSGTRARRAVDELKTALDALRTRKGGG